MPWYWRPWLASLFIANLVVPLLYITRFEAQVVFATTVVNSALFTILTALQGFTRLLSLAHLTWFPLIFFLWTTLDRIPADDAYGVWIRVLIVLNAISIVIDVMNVILYAAGDRVELVEGLSRAGVEPTSAS